MSATGSCEHHRQNDKLSKRVCDEFLAPVTPANAGVQEGLNNRDSSFGRNDAVSITRTS
jgi:hypothetical protein